MLLVQRKKTYRTWCILAFRLFRGKRQVGANNTGGFGSSHSMMSSQQKSEVRVGGNPCVSDIQVLIGGT